MGLIYLIQRKNFNEGSYRIPLFATWVHSRDQALASETLFQMHSQLNCSKVRLKIRFYKPCTSFWIWLRLRLVYKLSRFSKCQGYLSIAYLFYDRFTSGFVVPKQTALFSFLRRERHWERDDNSDIPETAPETPWFLLSVYVIGSEIFYLHLTEITWIHLLCKYLMNVSNLYHEVWPLLWRACQSSNVTLTLNNLSVTTIDCSMMRARNAFFLTQSLGHPI